jgi:hypothetical protein
MNSNSFSACVMDLDAVRNTRVDATQSEGFFCVVIGVFDLGTLPLKSFSTKVTAKQWTGGRLAFCCMKCLYALPLPKDCLLAAHDFFQVGYPPFFSEDRMVLCVPRPHNHYPFCELN